MDFHLPQLHLIQSLDLLQYLILAQLVLYDHEVRFHRQLPRPSLSAFELDHQLVSVILHHAHLIELLLLSWLPQLVCQVVLIADEAPQLNLEFLQDLSALNLIFELPSLYAFYA